jgi:hypothetical protein
MQEGEEEKPENPFCHVRTKALFSVHVYSSEEKKKN